MARIRTIKPEFWANEALSELPEATHMLAAALLNYADDEGYFNANPALVKAACSPIREPSVSIHGSLTELARIGYIRLGEGSDGKRYGHVIAFCTHQRISHPQRSKIKDIGICWEDSVNVCGSLSEGSTSLPRRLWPEQGTGNREQGTGNGTRAAENLPQAVIAVSAETPSPTRAPTTPGLVCRMLREAGVIRGLNPAHPDLIAVLAGGVTAEQVESTAQELIASKGDASRVSLPLVVATVKGRLADAQFTRPLSTLPGAAAMRPSRQAMALQALENPDD